MPDQTRKVCSQFIQVEKEIQIKEHLRKEWRKRYSTPLYILKEESADLTSKIALFLKALFFVYFLCAFKYLSRHHLFYFTLIVSRIIQIIAILFLIITICSSLTELCSSFSVFEVEMNSVNDNVERTSNFGQDEVKPWYINLLMCIDKLLICLTIYFVGEKIFSSHNEKRKKYANLNHSPIGFTIDKQLSNMVIITASFVFLGKILGDEMAIDIRNMGFGIAALIISLGVWSWLESHSHSMHQNE